MINDKIAHMSDREFTLFKLGLTAIAGLMTIGFLILIQ